MKNFYEKARPTERCQSFGRGVTVIELLVLISVIGLIILIVLPQLSQTRENQVLKSGVEDVLSSINKARGGTLSSLNSSEYGVRFQSDRVIIFKGKVFSAIAPDNETINIAAPASITNVTLGGVSGTSGDMYFNRLSGSPSTIGTVTLSTTSYTKIITISATGVASVN